MSRIEVPVGGTVTTVCFDAATVWPGDAWLEHARGLASRSLFVYDRQVRALEGARFPQLGPAGECAPGSGEEAKRWSSIETIAEAAMRHGVGRDGCMVGVGGGALCDVAAFAAAVYMRGVPVELVPTTLLAMVDASVGGKTAINFRGYKNVIGMFHPARRIDVHLGALSSLPARELESGLAEVVKASLLGDLELYGMLRREREAVLRRDPGIMAEVVRRCILLKAEIVAEDPEEKGRRAHLNLGHTFGHALEAVAGTGRVSHGAAVAWGIVRALELGVRLGQTDSAYRDEARRLLEDYGFGLRLADLAPRAARSEGARELLDAMRQDKKKLGGGIRFVLQRRQGETFVASGVPEADVLAVLSQEI